MNFSENYHRVRLQQLITIGAQYSLVSDGKGILATDNLAISGHPAVSIPGRQKLKHTDALCSSGPKFLYLMLHPLAMPILIPAISPSTCRPVTTRIIGSLWMISTRRWGPFLTTALLSTQLRSYTGWWIRPWKSKGFDIFPATSVILTGYHQLYFRR